MIEKFIKKKLRNIWNIVTQRPVSDWGVHDDAYEKSSKTHQKTWEESCLLAHESWRLLFGAKCSRKQSLHFLETRWLDIYHGVGGARHNTESRMELFAVSICSSTNTRSGLFSTVHAYRKLIVQHRRPRLADTNLWEHIPSTSIALSDTRSIACESSSNRKEADIFDFVFWPHASNIRFMESLVPRRSGIRINSSSIGQRLRLWCGCWYGRMWINQNFSSTRIRWNRNSEFKDGLRNREYCSGRTQEKDELFGRDSMQEQSSNAWEQANNVLTIFIL